MPAEPRSTRVTERCETHAARAAVARCERCGRRLCLRCAVPVRGEVIGQECLGEVLGPEAVPAPRTRVGRGRLDRAAGAALGVAALATALPWTLFGTGSSAFGAWALDTRWSMLAACASVVGLAVWLVAGSGRPIAARAAAAAGGALAAIGAGLAVADPPPFTKPAVGPVIALVAGLAAAGIGLVELRRSRAERV